MEEAIRRSLEEASLTESKTDYLDLLDDSDDYVVPLLPIVSEDDRRPCKFFLQNGRCRFGDLCHFSHTRSSSSSSSSSIGSRRPTPKPCLNWKNTGYCRYGAKCWFSHSEEREGTHTEKTKEDRERREEKEDEEGEGRGDKCVVCLGERKCIMLVPCNHVCLCEECAGFIMGEQRRECPMCRGKVTHSMKVFF